MKEIAEYINTDHHRPPHSGIGYRIPTDLAAAGRPNPTNYKPWQPEPTTTTGSTSIFDQCRHKIARRA